MPRSKSGKKRTPVDGSAIEKAIGAISGPVETRISIREASKTYKVPLATMWVHLKKFRLSGAQHFIYNVKYDVKKIFSEQEEQCLVKYIVTVAKMQYGLTKKGVRELAFKFAVVNKKKRPENWDKDNIAGEEWMRLFMNRHSKSLSIRKPEATSLSRSTSFNKNNVGCFFNNIEDVHRRFGPIPPERIWNTDETGLTTVQKPSRIVAPKGVKQIGSVTSAERGQLVTLIAAINGIGNHIPPMLIFPRVNFKEFMIKGAPPGTIGGANSSGWSNDSLFLKFLEHFNAHVKPSKDERVILFLDNHTTHLSVESVEYASRVGIIMVTFPPHTSHKLQPLDLTVFGPLKTFYNQSVDAWLMNNAGKTFDIYSIAEALATAYPKAFSTNNIINGFRSAGIYPFNRHIFSEEDFLGSYVTDRPAPESSNLVSNDTEAPSTSKTINADSNQTRNENTPPHTPNPIHTDTDDFISPEVIQPYPKAVARKVSNRGRKTGRTSIITDTPEREEIRRGKEKNPKTPREKQQIKKVQKKICESSSDSENDEVWKDIEKDSDDSMTLLELVEEDMRDADEQNAFDSHDLEVEDYVLVQFPQKKGTTKHFVGKICSKDKVASECQIQFYSRISQSNKFLKKSEEIFDVLDEDIIRKLPKPVTISGSERVQRQLWFEIDFNNYNVT